MPTTTKLIGEVTLSVDAANIEFTSIPATFNDLWLVLSLRSAWSATEDSIGMLLNGSTSSRSWRNISGDGFGLGSSTGTSNLFVGDATGDTATASAFASMSLYLPGYTEAKAKGYYCTAASERNTGGAWMYLIAGQWAINSAVTSIRISSLNAANLRANSSAFLYGIARS